MQRDVPRLVLAGTNSGCGKTTVTCAVLQALVARGLRIGAAKCGPDYIDPMFHSRVIGAKSSNLDPFFFDPDTMRYLLAHNNQDCDIAVIEGVMGYYDGLGLTSTRASTYETARETESPVVLVVNARGAALSVAAAVQGFLDFAPDSGIRGVILNGCSAMSYGPLARELENRLGVRACGYLPRLPECTLESRHLGLVTADEVADLREKLRKLAEAAEKTLELDALLEIAHNAPVLDFTPPVLPEKGAPVRIGVAREAHPWRLTALFFLLAGGLGGLVLALGLASGSVAAYVGRLYRAEISWPVLLGAALGFYALLHLVFRQAARHGGGEIMDATISIGGQSRAVRVLHDTGNTLRSPVTGQPVLVLEQTSLGGLLPPEVERIVTRRAPPEERMAQLHATDLGRRFSLLPFCSIGAPEGLLLAVCSDSVQIGGTTYPRTLVALSPGPVSDGGGYQALWGGTEGRKHEKAVQAAAGVAAQSAQAG